MLGNFASVALCSLLAAFGAAEHTHTHPYIEGSGQVSNVSITSGGLQRSYLLAIPPIYHPDFPTPLIVSYHGGTQTAEDQLELDQLTNPEFNERVIVVYPQGIDVNETNVWQGVPGVTVDDVQFTSDILDQVEKSHNIDKTRIWATGKSDGGGFANILACDATLSTRIAAFAPVSGAYYIDTSPCDADTVKIPCNPGRTHIPIIEFHGGNDTTIAYDGGARKGECLPSIPHFVREWAKRDDLDSHKNLTIPIAPDTVLYSFGVTGLVQHVYDSVIGHDWPSTVPNADNQKPGRHPASFNATPIILDFFYRHSLPLAFW